MAKDKEFGVKMPLVEALLKFLDHKHVAFHTPGHLGFGSSTSIKKLLGHQLFQADLTELEGLDNLHEPTGPIQQAQELAAQAWGSDQSYFLVNGSTSGVQAMLLATCAPGERVLLARNSHRSVIHGLVLSGAIPVWLEPDWNNYLGTAEGVSIASIEQALAAYPQAKALCLVYPTYYGQVGDLAATIELAHQKGLTVLVDSAHGSHFAYHPQLPDCAIALGADLVVHSAHKTLGALTQGAMLHRRGGRVDPQRLAQALRMLQTSSPSYPVMASLDAARAQMVTEGYVGLEDVYQQAQALRQKLLDTPYTWVEHPDWTRWTIALEGSGFALETWLVLRHHLHAELVGWNHAVFLTSYCTPKNHSEQLFSALASYPLPAGQPAYRPAALPKGGVQACSPREAYFAAHESVLWKEAVGRISAYSVEPYPPGIPVLLPGEVIHQEALDYLKAVAQAGGSVSGGVSEGYLGVVVEKC
jgi:arginine/lysine/ornithine decarboxylase